MKALRFPLCAALAAGALLGCGGGSDSDSNPAEGGADAPAVSMLGRSLLPPDGAVAEAMALDPQDLPPAQATESALAAEDLPQS